MNELIDIGIHLVLQGLIYSFVVMGVYFSSRVINFDDLTTEGSFGLGGALTAILLVGGFSPWLLLPFSMIGGGLVGILTGFLHTKMKMNNLISGLVVTTALFSICLKLAKSNAVLPEANTIFSASLAGSMGLMAIIAALILAGLQLFLKSELGLLFKAVGNNPQIVASLGKNVDVYKMAGLGLANSLTALAGSLFVQNNGFFSITGNVGTLVTGLAGLILAEMLGSKWGLNLIFGAILYQAIFALTIEFELEPVWNNLIKAVLIVILIQIKPRKQPIKVIHALSQ